MDQPIDHGHPPSTDRQIEVSLRFGQVSLFYLGFNPGPIDGILGPRTRAALIAYQKKRGIPVTGRLDDRMQEYLCMEAFAA